VAVQNKVTGKAKLSQLLQILKRSIYY